LQQSAAKRLTWGRQAIPARRVLRFLGGQLWEADRCAATAYVTTNGIVSRTLLPGREGHVGVTAHDNRRFVEAVLYRYRAGIPWRDLPERFGDPIKVHSRWAKSGVWQRIFQHLAADADNEYAMIDSTIVRAHQHSAGAQKKSARIRRSADRAAD
jgi:transposase